MDAAFIIAIVSNASDLFTQHDRLWRSNRFVYPVISRRSQGLSIGINLNPDKACNFDCVYCSVDRTVTTGRPHLLSPSPGNPGESRAVGLTAIRETPTQPFPGVPGEGYKIVRHQNDVSRIPTSGPAHLPSPSPGDPGEGRGGGPAAIPDNVLDLSVLADELRQLCDLAASGEIFNQPPFDQAPAALRRWNDVAFSGDGEPTSCRQLEEASKLVIQALAAFPSVKLVLITNATLLHQPRVETTLKLLDQHNGEIWAKLDAGTEAYFHQIERTRLPFDRVLSNIATVGQERAIVIQSLFLRLDGVGPSDAEIDAYLGRLRDLQSAGCQIKLVQVYTVARDPAVPTVTPLPPDRLDQIADRVKSLNLPASVFYGPA